MVTQRRDGRPRCQRTVGRQLDSPSERILASEMHRREPLVDDRGFMTRRPIEIVESAAPHDSQAEGFEIPRTDHDLRDGRRLFTCGERTALDRQETAVAPPSGMFVVIMPA